MADHISKTDQISIASRASTSATFTERRRLIFSGQLSIFDSLFPPFESLTQRTSLTRIFYQIELLYFGFQLITVSLYTYGFYFFRKHPFIKYLSAIFLWTESNEETQSITIIFYVTSILFIFYVFIIISMLLYYKQHRQWLVLFLYIIRLYAEIIFPVCLIPNGIFIGRLANLYISRKKITTLIYLIFSSIYEIVMYGQFAISNLFISSSPYFPNHIFAQWNPLLLNTILVFYPVCGFIQFFFSQANFQHWVLPALIIVNIPILIYLTILVRGFIFISFPVNDIFTAIFITNITTNVGSFIFYAIDRFASISNLYYYSPIIFILGIVVFTVTIILFRRITNKQITGVQDILRHSTDVSSLEEKFSQNNFVLNETNALLLLHIGISYGCDDFLDWSLIKLLAGHESTSVLTECMRMISCFPQESRLLNLLFRLFFDKKTITLRYRFLAYQIQRIKSSRQTSSSMDIADNLQKLMQATQTCISEVYGFWQKVPSDPTVFVKLADSTRSLEARWKEALQEHPNNYGFREQYTRFVVECLGDFRAGVIQKYETSLLDQGYSFAKDWVFRSFIRRYPFYLKKRILDVNGNYLSRKGDRSRGSTSDSNTGIRSYSSSSNKGIDPETEEQLAVALFKHAKTRLEMQRALTNREVSSVAYLRIVTTISFFIIIIASIVCFLVFKNEYNLRVANSERTYAIDKAMITVANSHLTSVLLYGKQLNLVSNTQYIDQLVEEDRAFSSSYLKDNVFNEFTSSFQQELLGITDITLNQVKDIESVFKDNSNIYEIVPSFIKSNLDYQYCYGGYPSPGLKTSFETFLNGFYSTYKELAVLQISDSDDLSVNDQLCQATINLITLPSAILQIHETISLNQELLKNQSSRKHFYNEIFFPIIVFILIAPSVFIGFFVYIKERKKLLQLMSAIDPQYKEEAAQPLTKDNNPNKDRENQVRGIKIEHTLKLIVYPILVIVIYFVISILFFVEIYISNKENSTFKNLFEWILYCTSVEPYMYLGTSFLALFIVLKHPTAVLNFKASNYSTQLQMGVELLVISLDKAYMFMQGSTNLSFPPCRGFDKQVDQLTYQSQCVDEDGNNGNTIHKMMQCAGFSQLAEIMHSYTVDFMRNYGSITLGNETFLLLQHQVKWHLAPLLESISSRLLVVLHDQLSYHVWVLAIFMVAEIIADFILDFLIRHALQMTQGTFEAAMHLLRRIPPLGIISSTELLDYLLHRKSSKESIEMTRARSVIHNSDNAIVCVSNSGTIEVVNPAVSSLLGYSVEQLLGQPISILFKEKDFSEEIGKQMDLMRGGQSSLSYETHVQCVSDNDEEIACQTTIIGINDEKKSENSTSFVIILRNEEALVRQRDEAEKAKKQSEDLLYHILPRDIVLRLNRGEKNISFSVPCASIIFLDIQRFSDYASSLTPSQIMGNLSVLFEAYDRLLLHYPLLIKIKLIGDCYMAAGGIFNPGEPPSSHAEQTVKFGLEALSELEEINIKLSASFQVRIGINTGGPLIAGVLGTDKPAFDIIGDPINVAARLQSTDIAGRIQISQDTYELIQNLELNVEKRDGVFLKGKGKSVTYLLFPVIQTSFSQLTELTKSINSERESKTAVQSTGDINLPQ